MDSLPTPPSDLVTRLFGQSLGGPPRGTRTILLVDDEDEVGAIVRETLEEAGYHVLLARDGDEALVVADWHTGPIHLLVTDVMMRHVDGGELIGRLSPQRGETKLLCISGYADSEVVRHAVVARGIPFLAKPFTPDALLRAVREVLAAPRA